MRGRPSALAPVEGIEVSRRVETRAAGEREGSLPSVEPPGSRCSHQLDGRVGGKQMRRVGSVTDEECVEPGAVAFDVEELGHPFPPRHARRRNVAIIFPIAYRMEVPADEMKGQPAPFLGLDPGRQMNK